MNKRFIKLVYGLYIAIFYRNVFKSFTVKCEDKSPEESNVVDYNVDSIPLKYVPGTGYTVSVIMGGQTLNLLLHSTICGIFLFENSKKICNSDVENSCYNPNKSTTATWCDTTMTCLPGKFNYECREIHSPYSIKDFTASPFRIFGNEFKIYTVEGYESLRMALHNKKSDVMYDKVPVKLARHLDRYDIRIFKNVDGLLGIAGPEVCCRTSIWDRIIREYRGFFVIDINPPENVRFPSKLYLGTDRLADEDIKWSEKRQVGGLVTNSSLQFTMYDLKICNVSLFGKTSSNWEATIDLSTPYMVLPKNFWITLMKYLPVDPSCFTDDTQPRLCKLLPSERYFPIMEFKLSNPYFVNFEKCEPQTVKIPLENLLEDDGKSKTIMIVPDEFRDKSPYTLNPSIKLGYKVLESLNVVVDTEGYRIGLVPKNELVGSLSKCAEVPVCIGDQVYEPALNVCVDPMCSMWLMKRLNPESRVCETSFLAKILFTTIISVLVIAEFYCNFARRHILKITSRLCQ
ncbi:erythrocyte membrane-associated malaria antigen-like [Theileria orientalis strain Shintoku]|uniref:Erythrocyte membrane-associated malaria antigen-like n=1 Tax=Theileria orientalis strain Shintoku TaxID=869250 RepID=J4D719_THEOR|nr:erythrocyte membrane-associated malaria antigen-like [Theileria orientalis strain Shintoku]BAM39905.1 erythrocyte membrane-associated malaria antigen-like [Theileria orientalis strain Shintoku]|eukprot:XP_009690206.1 erythrocyte membrane-associated malaria antigen-like [Theileria orientalis strain Shintoku]